MTLTDDEVAEIERSYASTHGRDLRDLPINQVFWLVSVVPLLLSERAEHIAMIQRLTAALAKIERWDDADFPATGQKWDDGSPVPYRVLYGSNGERDFMKEIARVALLPGGEGK